MAFPGSDLYGHLMYAEGRIVGKSKQCSSGIAGQIRANWAYGRMRCGSCRAARGARRSYLYESYNNSGRARGECYGRTKSAIRNHCKEGTSWPEN